MDISEDIVVKLVEEKPWKPGSTELIIRQLLIINPKVYYI